MTLLIIIDILGVFASYQFSYFLRVNVFPKFLQFPEPLPAMIFNPVYLPLVFIFFFWYEDLYTKRLPLWEEIRQIWKASFLASLTLFAIISLGKLSASVSRTVIVLTFLNSLWGMPIVRLIGKKIMLKAGFGKRKAIILGAGLTGELLLKSFSIEKNMGYEVIGFLDDDVSKSGKYIGGVKVLGKLDEIEKFLDKDKDIEVIIAIPGMLTEKMVELVNSLQQKVKKVSFIPDLFGIPFLEGDMNFFFNNQILVLNVKNNLKNPVNRLFKKIFDICGSILILIILLPLILVVSIVIMLTSKGSAIYTHERIGFKGKKFKCYKFRTMYEEGDERLKNLLENNPDLKVEWEKTFKLKDDPRITKIGKFLRKTSLDELLQIFNVLKGEMSLVGPRPVLSEELDKYYGKYSDYYYEVYPGLTGLWQVSGRSSVDYKKRVSLDVWYVSNWSLWLDIVILIRTIKVVLRREGAY